MRVLGSILEASVARVWVEFCLALVDDLVDGDDDAATADDDDGE